MVDLGKSAPVGVNASIVGENPTGLGIFYSVNLARALDQIRADLVVYTSYPDAVALADAMHRVLTDRGLREDLRRRGFERATLFSWRRTAEQMSRLLDEARACKG